MAILSSTVSKNLSNVPDSTIAIETIVSSLGTVFPEMIFWMVVVESSLLRASSGIEIPYLMESSIILLMIQAFNSCCRFIIYPFLF